MSSTLNPSSQPQGPMPVESLSRPPAGYPQIAEFMADNPEMLMVRRFRGLNARNLLYFQAELVYIEQALLKREQEDAKAEAKEGDLRSDYSIDFKAIMKSRDDDSTRGEQWRFIQQMRATLREYNDVLIQQAALAKIGDPSDYDRKTMQEWYERDDLANLPLLGDDDHIWAKPGATRDGTDVSPSAKDLICVNERSTEIDRFTAWIAEKIMPHWYYSVASRLDKNKGVHRYRESAMKTFTGIFATTLSSLLPVASIVVLWVVHSMPARLGIIAGFTTAFSLVVSMITSATRSENFAATAAFAAVQVVFVGTAGNGTSSG